MKLFKKPLNPRSIFTATPFCFFVTFVSLIPAIFIHKWNHPDFLLNPFLYFAVPAGCLIYFWFIQNDSRGYVTALDRKGVLITGCDTGFGNLLARRLDSLGLHVFAACLDASGSAAKELKSVCSERMHVVQLDVTSDKQVSVCAEEVKRLCDNAGLRGLWGLVNNAGIAVLAPIEWTSTPDFCKTIDVNLTGAFRVTNALLPLIRHGQGRIVNVASMAGRVATSPFGAYCVSKTGLIALSDVLRKELRRFGVHVSTIEPGFYKTPMVDFDLGKSFQRYYDATSDDVKEAYGEERPQRMAAKMDKMKKAGRLHANLAEVTDVMEHALLARTPNDSYCPHWTHTLTKFLATHSPAFISDALFG